MKRDEIRTSELFTKYMRYTNSTDCGKYILYEFTDESNNVGLHYQIKPELLEDKKQIALARLFNTKASKLHVGDICLVICKCREVHEENYDKSAMYLNVDRILKPLVKYEIETRLYNGVKTEFAVEHNITSWDEI
jgi:hypothetical protein